MRVSLVWFCERCDGWTRWARAPDPRLSRSARALIDRWSQTWPNCATVPFHGWTAATLSQFLDASIRALLYTSLLTERSLIIWGRLSVLRAIKIVLIAGRFLFKLGLLVSFLRYSGCISNFLWDDLSLVYWPWNLARLKSRRLKFLLAPYGAVFILNLLFVQFWLCSALTWKYRVDFLGRRGKVKNYPYYQLGFRLS